MRSPDIREEVFRTCPFGRRPRVRPRTQFAWCPPRGVGGSDQGEERLVLPSQPVATVTQTWIRNRKQDVTNLAKQQTHPGAFHSFFFFLFFFFYYYFFVFFIWLLAMSLRFITTVSFLLISLKTDSDMIIIILCMPSLRHTTKPDWILALRKFKVSFKKLQVLTGIK